MAEPVSAFRIPPLSLGHCRFGVTSPPARLDNFQVFPYLLRSRSERRRHDRGMADFLSALGIILFTVAMLALIKGLERV
jgi:hypothetical protein